MGARAAGADAELTQNGVAAIAQAMGDLGGGADLVGYGSGSGSGEGDQVAGGFDGDGAADVLDWPGGDGTGGDGAPTGGSVTPAGGDIITGEAATIGEPAPVQPQTLRIGGKVVTVAPRIRLIPSTPPPRVVPPPPIVVEDNTAAPPPGTRAKAPPATVSSRVPRRGTGAFNQACVLLFFHRKGKYFLFATDVSFAKIARSHILL